MKLTIVTVNRNNSEGLKRTIESVLLQSFKDYEYIVIDGASTDDSISVIESFSKNNTIKWKSEPDKGVYDAMNKALLMASGEWVCFMNSGDCFNSSSVLKDIFVGHHEEVAESDVIYGDTVNVFSWGKIVKSPLPLEKIMERMPFCHQSSFVRTDKARKFMFDCKYKIAADYDLFYKLYNDHVRFMYIPVIIAAYEAEEGMSSVNIGRRETDYAVISGRYKTLSWKMEYLWRMSVYYIVGFLKKITPGFVLDLYRRCKCNA